MLQRERGDYEDRSWELCWVVILDAHHRIDCLEAEKSVTPLYKCQQIGDRKFPNMCVFYNPFTGWLAKNYSVAKESTVGTGENVKGGILAESMGLGKYSIFEDTAEE